MSKLFGSKLSSNRGFILPEVMAGGFLLILLITMTGKCMSFAGQMTRRGNEIRSGAQGFLHNSEPGTEERIDIMVGIEEDQILWTLQMEEHEGGIFRIKGFGEEQLKWFGR